MAMSVPHHVASTLVVQRQHFGRSLLSRRVGSGRPIPSTHVDARPGWSPVSARSVGAVFYRRRFATGRFAVLRLGDAFLAARRVAGFAAGSGAVVHEPGFAAGVPLDCLRNLDRKSTRLNSSHTMTSRMPSSA